MTGPPWIPTFRKIVFRCLLALSMLLPSGCRQKTQRRVETGYYHWQNTLDLSSSENDYLDSIFCKKLYIKVLDIGLNKTSGAIEPYSRLAISDTSGLHKRQIVPAIFITNAVFKKISPEQTEWLARKIDETLRASPLTPPGGFSEIQFDCDWSASTRQAYFRFLETMKKRLSGNSRLSATIRLHQYKFPEQTGVPPVARGMLMFYNTGDIESETTENSILDPKDARKYVEGAPEHYPLPLDLALPVFSWTLVYREGDFWKIINGIPEDLRDTQRFETQAGATNRLQVRKATFLAGHYLRPGDRLRVESISPALLQESAGLAARMALADEATVAFFQLDSFAVAQYPPPLIQALCQKICLPEKN